MKVAVIVMARMKSSRLPGKTLMKAAGKPLLGHLLDRLDAVRSADSIIVATSIEPQDDAIATFCGNRKTAVFRGSESDTMERFVRAADATGAEIALRITGDCPLVDPKTVDLVIEAIKSGAFDYVSTDLVPQYPNGMGCDAYTRAALSRLYEASRHLDPEQSWMLTRDPALGLRCGLAPGPGRGSLSQYRVTVDTPEDFEVVQRIFTALVPRKRDFGLDDVADVLERHPEWTQINAGVTQKTGPHKRSA